MTSLQPAPLTHRAVLKLALPVMISNVSTPLIGVVDTAVVGRLGDPAYIGAAAIGGLIFTFVFWSFGFLRMGTTGLTAQALGAADSAELANCLGRALLAALLLGVGLMLLQWPIRESAFVAIHASQRVEGLARNYFDIRIWAAPATLANYALFGWFVGLGRTGIGLILQIILNLVNMALDVLFVIGCGWDVRGVATGTLIAEYVAAAIGIAIALRHMRGMGATWSLRQLLEPGALKRTFGVNRDIMIRTMALMAVFVWFASQGARQGDVILAANSILLQFISMSAYFLDGLAFATEALVGQAIGAGRRAALSLSVKMTAAWAAGVALLMSAVLALTEFLTVDPAARAAANTFLPWAAGAPLLGVWAFQLDGIFIGATHTADMRNAMLASLAIFLGACWLLAPFGNHGLWAAFYVQYVARTATLLRYYPRIVRSLPASTSSTAGVRQPLRTPQK